MRGGIFWRTFLAFLLITVFTVLLFTAVLATSLQIDRQESYEAEVFSQAREVAEYMSRLNLLSSIRENSTMQFVIRSKLADIHDRYNADVWIVSYGSNYNYVEYLDSSWNTSEYLTSEAVNEQLLKISRGEEIRVKGLFPELGKEIVTIGVPWKYSEGHVVGAVLLHISTESLQVHITDMLPMLLLAGLGVLILGTLFSLVLARSQIQPLREITDAVNTFAKGKLDRRVNLQCGGELQKLGDSINQMAFELSNLEESRKSFVANVSHELRSPLTSIRGYVEALQDGTIDPADRAKYMGVVLDETNRLTDLVRDLLDLSRMDSGKFPLHLQRTDLNELIRLSVLSFEKRIEEKQIEVEVTLDDDPRFVRADPDRIRQVMTNLIDNALKFLPEKGRLSVGARREGKNILVWVEDNGPGISPEDLPFIFDRFYKADKAHTSGMGTGLGLSIVKRILDQHDSRIQARSEEGKTVFSFALREDRENKEIPVNR